MSVPADDPLIDLDVARRVGELYLRHADQLASVDKVRSTLAARHTELDTQVKMLMSSRLEAGRESLDLLQHSASLVGGIRTTYAFLCSESTSLAAEYPLIKQVNIVRTNLLQTKQELSRMLDIPGRLAVLKQALEDDSNILHVYTNLTELVRLRKLATAQSQNLEAETLEAVKDEFKGLDESFKELEQIMWARLSDCVNIGKTNPALLVKIMRIVEREDRSGGLRGYMGMCFEVLQDTVKRRFEDTLAPWENDISGAVKAIEEELIRDVEAVSACVAPCFPPRFDIHTFFVARYHQHLARKLNELAKSDDINIADILHLVSWVETTYEPYLQRQKMMGLQPPLITCLEALTGFYKSHLHKQMFAWTERTVTSDPDAGALITNGIYYSHSPTMLFTFLNQQMDVVHMTRYAPLTVEVASECVSVISHFQTLFIAFIENTSKLPFGYLIALCNNSNRAYEYTVEFFDNKVGAVLDDRGLGVSVDVVADGFSKVAKKAMVRLIAMMMEDMNEIYPKFFMAEWYTANPPLMSSIVVTLKDYFTTELSPHLLTPAFQDLTQECAKRIVKVYVGHLIEKKHPPFNAGTVVRMQKDIDELRSFFSDYIREKVLEDMLQPVVLLRQLLDANPQLIGSYYESLLEHFPDASLNVIEVLLDNRQDLERAEVKDALAACQAISARRTVRRPSGGAMLLGESTTVKRKKKNKTKAFFTKLLQQF